MSTPFKVWHLPFSLRSASMMATEHSATRSRMVKDVRSLAVHETPAFCQASSVITAICARHTIQFAAVRKELKHLRKPEHRVAAGLISAHVRHLSKLCGSMPKLKVCIAPALAETWLVSWAGDAAAGIKKNSTTVFSAHQMGTARMGTDPDEVLRGPPRRVLGGAVHMATRKRDRKTPGLHRNGYRS